MKKELKIYYDNRPEQIEALKIQVNTLLDKPSLNEKKGFVKVSDLKDYLSDFVDFEIEPRILGKVLTSLEFEKAAKKMNGKLYRGYYLKIKKF